MVLNILNLLWVQYPGMNIVWDPSQTQQVLQPNVQLSSQTGQPLVSGSPQQPVQSNYSNFCTFGSFSAWA